MIMKKLLAILMAAALMAAMMTPAMAAYTALTPAVSTITHKLELTISTATSLDYNIKYKFESSTPEVINASSTGVTDAGQAVTGKPVINNSNEVLYSVDDVFTGNPMTHEKVLAVDWSQVQISQPGIYRWTITQTVETNAPQVSGQASPSNVGTFYLFQYVFDNGNGLESTFVVSTSDTGAAPKNVPLRETYPAKTVDLTISKNVDGNQASKEQYFPFTIKLTAPSVPDSSVSYSITATTDGSYDVSVPATAYHPAATNPTTISLANGTTGNFVLWLKHGQSVTINDMIYGSSYEITEGGNAGYDAVTVEISDTDNSGAYDPTTYKTTDERLEDNAIVAYTNTKNPVTPTGIDLQTGAAIAGIILAMGLMMVVFMGKRKEETF